MARLLQQYILQRGWSSRSCTTMNRIGKSPVLVTSSIAATMVATTSRIHHYQRKVDSEGPDGTVPLPSPSAPPPTQEYDDEFAVNTINNATLPYFRNPHKGSAVVCSASENNSISNPTFPKSASSWGPLHKPMHWKVSPRTKLLFNSPAMHPVVSCLELPPVVFFHLFLDSLETQALCHSHFCHFSRSAMFFCHTKENRWEMYTFIVNSFCCFSRLSPCFFAVISMLLIIFI